MIYFLSDTRAIKIGFTRDELTLHRRIKELQTGNPFKLQIMGTISGELDAESQLHDAFARYRLNGGKDWYDRTILEAISELLESEKKRGQKPPLKAPMRKS